MVRPGEHQWHRADEEPPVQALLEMERPASRAVGKGQEGDEEGEVEVVSGGTLLDFLQTTNVGRATLPGLWRKIGKATRKRRNGRWRRQG